MKITLMYKIMALLMTIMSALGIGLTKPPATDDPITVNENANMTFIAWGDTQVSNYLLSRNQYTKNACEDLVNSDIEFDVFVVAGDMAENGLNAEYATLADYFSPVKTKAYVFCEGNHDVRLKSYSMQSKRFIKFVNALNRDNNLSIDRLNYTYEANGYKFIVLSTDRMELEENWFSNEQLKWLDNELALSAKDGKPVFVVNHQPLAYTHGLPDTWGSPVESAGSVGKQSDELFDIMNKYQNVIFITGHLHTAFGQYLYEKKDNVNLVNVPSIGISNKDGFYNQAGLGFIVNVTDDQVIFSARDFALGKYVPDGDIVIDLVK